MSRRAQVCGECGKVFLNPLSYNMHVRTHQPWIECDKCPFRTKLAQKLKWHELIHRRNPGLKCFTCKKSFSRIEGLLVHQKKLHYIYQCKYCGTVWRENESLRMHLQEVYNRDGSLPCCWVQKHAETVPDVPLTRETDESQPGTTLHQTAGRDTREVRTAQHVDVADFSKLLVKQEKESFENSEPSPAAPALPDALGTGESAQQRVQVANTLTAPLTTLPSSSAFPAGNAILTYNPVSQSLQLISPHFILQQPEPRHEKEKGNLDTPSPLPPQYVPSVQGLAPPPTITTFRPIASSASKVTPTPQDAPVPDVTPSTSVESDSQGGTASVTLIQQVDKDGKNIGTLFRCKLCPHVFLTAGDFEEHFYSAHPEEPFLKFPISWLKKRQKIQQPKVNVMFRPKAPRAKLRLPCDACTEVFTTYRGLAKHKKLKHKKAYKCPVCGIVMRSNYRLMRHQKMMHKDKLRCRYFCGMLCDTYEELLSHYKVVHKKNPTNQECPHCQRSFIYEGFLMNHLEKCAQCPPDKRPAHVCGNCDGFFPNIEAYNEHALSCLTPSKERSDLESPSTSLGKRKTQVFDLEQETNEPEETTTVKLEDADESDDPDLDAGKKISDEDFPDIDAPKAPAVKHRPPSDDHKMCRYCPDVFLKKANAITHILYSHSDIAKRMIVAPMKCDMCGIIFKNPTCLCKHLMKHYTRLNKWDAFVPRDILKTVKVRGYCWICDTHQDGLKGSHVIQRDRVIDETVDIEELINTDIQPLECDECKELFPTRKLFWHHVKKHLAKLPFEEVHYGDFQGDGKSFQCRKCSFKCSDREGLYEHIADHFMVRYEDLSQESKEADELEDGKTGSAETRAEGDAEASGDKGTEGREKGDSETSEKGDREVSEEKVTEDREKSGLKTSRKGDTEATGKVASEDGKKGEAKESENDDVKDSVNDNVEDSVVYNVEDSDIDDVEVISQESDSDMMDNSEEDY